MVKLGRFDRLGKATFLPAFAQLVTEPFVRHLVEPDARRAQRSERCLGDLAETGECLAGFPTRAQGYGQSQGQADSWRCLASVSLLRTFTRIASALLPGSLRLPDQARSLSVRGLRCGAHGRLPR
jgi:hypothetical protein